VTPYQFFHYGFQPATLADIEKLCTDKFDQIVSKGSLTVSPVDSLSGKTIQNLTFYPLWEKDILVGLLVPILQEEKPLSHSWDKVLQLVTDTISRLGERAKIERQLTHLNTYLTVSSMLAQSMSLQELLETALYCSMEAVAAEAASVLLLDNEKENLMFYQVEGPKKPLLETATFPADKGVAGYVLRTQQSQVINDVPNDPRFYGNIDAQSGFCTRNMIAIPLTAGGEQIGVLEVINKGNVAYFSEEEHLLLSSIAEEIAFAIRNAKVFEYVVNSYCKQRQGQSSCKGCKRPLGSWTPCLKYREVGL
jgi:transcriptional regulator with GAF, ATPase, and Fis domain